MRRNKGITIITLVVTIIILLILTGVTIAILTGENGILQKASIAKEENNKQIATEIMNLKITNAQINSYKDTEKMPTLQYLSDRLCEDNEIQYVLNESKKSAKLEKITVTGDYIYTKLVDYPYEFKIDSKLKLASIDGIEIADNNVENKDNISKEEFNILVARIGELEKSKSELLSQIENLEKNKAIVSTRVENLEKNKTRSGSVSFGEMKGWGWVERDIKFDKPLENNNYSVTVTSSGSGDKWTFVEFNVDNKTVNGFRIMACSSAEIDTGNINANWILSMN